MENPVDLNGFVLAMTESAYAQVKAACDGLTDEQFFCQPTPETNSIAWLIWHMSRARDLITSNISGENQVARTKYGYPMAGPIDSVWMQKTSV